MIRKSAISFLAMSAVSAVALGATAAAPAPALPTAKSCPAVGDSSSGADQISVTFHNRSVTVKARVKDTGPGATRLYVSTYAGTTELAERSSSAVDQGSKNVEFDVPANVRGGADKVIYLVQTTEGETSAAASCTR